MQRILPTRRTACQLFAAVPLAWQASAAERGMFLALNNVLVSSRVPWPDFARLAAKVGYPGTDVMLKPAMKEGAAATRDLLAELKIRPAVLDFPVEFRKDDATFQTGLAGLAEAAKFAKAIGCPRMMTYIMSSSPTPKDELRALLKQRFTAAGKILADSDVRLGLEFLGPLHIRKQFPNEFIWKMPDMLEFAKECGPNIGLTLDIWHWHHAGATTQNILDAGRDRIVHVHFNDAPNLPPEQIKDNERLLPGEGVIDTVGFLHALKKIGYRDALSIEVFGRGLKDMPPEQAAKLALDAGDGQFKKAGIATPWVHGR